MAAGSEENLKAPGESPGLTTGLSRIVGRSVLASAAATALCLPFPFVLGLANVSYLPVVGLFWGVAWLLSLTEVGQSRRVFLGLFGLAFVARLIVLIPIFWVGTSAGGPFLGPDSTAFFTRSVDLAAAGFHVAKHPIQLFRDFAVAHYYVFAALVRYVNADLFGLQLFNCGLTALVGPLMFASSARVFPRLAILLGLIVALYPSLIVLSALDLLKDPSVLLGTLLTVWALVRLVEARHVASGCGFALVASVAMVYLRLDRFYVAAYLAVSIMIVGFVSLFRQRLTFSGARTAALVAAVLVVAEVLPIRLGWPSTPDLLARSTRWAVTQPWLRDYAPGLLNRLWAPADEKMAAGAEDERLNRAGAEVAAEEESRTASARPGVVPKLAAAAATALALAAAAWAIYWRRREVRRIVPFLAATALVVAGASIARSLTGNVPVLVWTANLFRRLYGPYVWIMPSKWDAREILTHDYLLYPGMLAWYALLPLMVAGLVVCVGYFTANRREAIALLALWIFTAGYWAQYLIFNFSYRHRETMFPFLLLFGLIGTPVMANKWWRRTYRGYWVVLVVTAALHLWLTVPLNGNSL